MFVLTRTTEMHRREKIMELAVVVGNSLPSVGDRIVEARKAKNMTQLDLAKRLGVSRAAVGQWEIDATSPSIAKLNEVAMVLEVAPEWLAYHVKGGEVKVVYRNPERDNIVWVPELSFGETLEEIKETEKWGMPADYLIRDLRSSPSETVVCVVNSHAVEPDYEYGDKVFVDRADKRPSPGGIFLYWDGIGAAFARMNAVPGAEPKVRISQKGQDMIELPLASVQIIGRVKGRIQKR
jgi:transcriptional regulator with XRE-family HTH domain